MKRQILAMVGGADKLCSYLADGKQNIRVVNVASQHFLSLSEYGLLTKTYSNPSMEQITTRLISRTSIEAYGYAPSHCLCRGRHPKDIYVKKE